MDRTVITLMGPTAIGKTQMVLELARRLDLHVVSVDSAMIYRGLDIGTAKPSSAELLECPHALVDICEPEERFSVKQFLSCADEEVRLALEHDRLPVLVGGSMLYFRAFRDGLSTLPEADATQRAAIRAEIADRGFAAVHQELAQVDPDSAARIHPHNLQRLERALEVYRMTGHTISDLWKVHAGIPVEERLDCRLRELAVVDIDRSELHQRIETRVDDILESGFEDEVRGLMARPNLTSESQSMKSIGYKQMWRELTASDEDSERPTIRDAMVFATRQFARRQLVWLRRWRTRATMRCLPHTTSIDSLIAACTVS